MRRFGKANDQRRRFQYLLAAGVRPERVHTPKGLAAGKTAPAYEAWLAPGRGKCGCSATVAQQTSNLLMRVRFPSFAPDSGYLPDELSVAQCLREIDNGR